MDINYDQVYELRRSLVAFTRMAYKQGLSSGVSGNPSARLLDNPNLVLIKATGKCFGEVEPEDFVLVEIGRAHV